MTSHQDLSSDAFARHWDIQAGCTYLNHGSFGPSPIVVQQRRSELLHELNSQPMEFLVRQCPQRLEEAAQSLGQFLNGVPDRFAFVPNATAAMNVVAANVELQPGDEVLLTDHEYGAVVRIWGQRCRQSKARTVLARLPIPVTSDEEIVDAIFQSVTPQTRVLVVSHLTSPTALILPVQKICRRAKEAGLLTVIDGPHAPAQLAVDLQAIEADFYCASCHKWMCAPFGTGFLYVAARHKQGLKPNIISWGRSLRGDQPKWTDEFHWPGTFDPTPYATLPRVVQFWNEIGLDRFRTQTHAFAQFARQQLLELTDRPALSPDDDQYYGSMVTVPFDPPQDPRFPDATRAPGAPHPLQLWLAQEHHLEVPILEWRGQWFIRVSCHLYNTAEQIEHLVKLLRESRCEIEGAEGSF